MSVVLDSKQATRLTKLKSQTNLRDDRQLYTTRTSRVQAGIAYYIFFSGRAPDSLDMSQERFSAIQLRPVFVHLELEVVGLGCRDFSMTHEFLEFVERHTPFRPIGSEVLSERVNRQPPLLAGIVPLIDRLPVLPPLHLLNDAPHPAPRMAL